MRSTSHRKPKRNLCHRANVTVAQCLPFIRCLFFRKRCWALLLCFAYKELAKHSAFVYISRHCSQNPILLRLPHGADGSVSALVQNPESRLQVDRDAIRLTLSNAGREGVVAQASTKTLWASKATPTASTCAAQRRSIRCHSVHSDLLRVDGRILCK